jgi:hypothetical protein
MTVTTPTTTHWEKGVRWLGRAVSLLAVVFWLLVLLDIIFCGTRTGCDCIKWELVLIIGLATSALVSMIMTLLREKVGAFMMILWGPVFASILYFAGQSCQAVTMLVLGLPFLIAGGLFLGCCWLHQKPSYNPSEGGK